MPGKGDTYTHAGNLDINQDDEMKTKTINRVTKAEAAGIAEDWEINVTGM